MSKSARKNERKSPAARSRFVDSLAQLSPIIDHIKNNWVDIPEMKRKVLSKLNIKNKGIE